MTNHRSLGVILTEHLRTRWTSSKDLQLRALYSGIFSCAISIIIIIARSFPYCFQDVYTPSACIRLRTWSRHDTFSIRICFGFIPSFFVTRLITYRPRV